MHPLERAALDWIAAANPSIADVLAEQIALASISNREYTNGGGVFVSFSFSGHDEVKLPQLPVQKNRQLILEGPRIESTELELGADVILFVNEDGVISSLEIQSLANDYPLNRHPEDFGLAAQEGNHLDLRE